MVKRLYLFRHGETDWNREGRLQGHIDVPMNDRGREQMVSLVAPLRGFGIEAVLSSDLARAEESARIVAGHLGVPIFVDRGLREANVGGAQGLTRDEIIAKFGSEVVARWSSSLLSDADVAFTGGETGAEILRRVFDVLGRFAEAEPFERFGVATHGGVIRRVLHSLLPEGAPLVQIPNGILYEIVYDRKKRNWRLPE